MWSILKTLIAISSNLDILKRILHKTQVTLHPNSVSNFKGFAHMLFLVESYWQIGRAHV